MQENERKLQETEAGAEQTSDNIKTSLEESPISEPGLSEENIAPISEPESTPVEAVSEEKSTASEEVTEEETEKVIEEIEESNAEDAEDTDNEKRHHIPFLDYHAMSIENLVGELQRLVKNEKVQAISKHVSGIKYEFDQKFQEFLEHKKEEFVANGGNEIDFRYNSVTKRQYTLSLHDALPIDRKSVV